jgi:hypothetical protein
VEIAIIGLLAVDDVRRLSARRQRSCYRPPHATTEARAGAEAHALHVVTFGVVAIADLTTRQGRGSETGDGAAKYLHVLAANKPAPLDRACVDASNPWRSWQWA